MHIWRHAQSLNASFLVNKDLALTPGPSIGHVRLNSDRYQSNFLAAIETGKHD